MRRRLVSTVSRRGHGGGTDSECTQRRESTLLAPDSQGGVVPRWLPSDDTGATEREVQIITAILIVCGLAAGLLMLGVFSKEQLRSRQSDSVRGIEHATQVMQRTLAFAVVPRGMRSAISQADNHEITFFASLDRDGVSSTMPTMVTYRFDSERSCLQETTIAGQVINATPAWPQNTARVTCVAKLDGPPTFSYFQIQPATETNSAVPKMNIPDGGLVMNPLAGTSVCPTRTPYDLGCVVAVDIDARVASEVGDGDRSTPWHMRIGLPNVANAIANQ